MENRNTLFNFILNFLIKKLFGLIPLLIAITGLTTSYSKNPNIIIYLADDMGYGDPQVYQTDSKIPTPNIDKLAQEGMRFTDAHSPSSVCTPTRYGILTGRYAWRTWLKNWVINPYGFPLIENNRETIASLLKGKGYATGIIGKWHLGIEWARNDGVTTPWQKTLDETKVDLSKPFKGGPLAVGFDYWFGVDVPNYPPYCFIENNQIIGPVPTQPKPSNVYGNGGLMQDGWKLVDILPTLEQKANSFIRDHVSQNPDQPFFLYFPSTAPHTPIHPAPEYQGKSQAGDYGDLVAQVDGMLGSLVKTVDSLGLRENTLIIFTSDNGSPARAGDPHLRDQSWAATGAVISMFGHNPNAPWRGMKADIQEAGHHVPFIVSWPKTISQNSINTELISSVDLFSTISALVGEAVSISSGEDSYNMLDVFFGNNINQPAREALVHHSGSGKFSLRQGEWKYVDSWGSGGFTNPQNATAPNGEPGRLFNLSNDTTEQTSYFLTESAKVSELENLLNKYKQDGRSVTLPRPITSAIKIQSPNSSDAWNPNQQHTISWFSTGDIQKVTLEYSIDNGANWLAIAATQPAEIGEYNWKMPGLSSNSLLIKVSDASNVNVYDLSNPFQTTSIQPSNRSNTQVKFIDHTIKVLEPGNHKIEIFSYEGIVIFQNLSSVPKSYSTSTLTKTGVYHLRIKTNSGFWSKRISIL